MRTWNKVYITIGTLFIVVVVAFSCFVQPSYAGSTPKAPSTGTNGGTLVKTWVWDGYQYAKYKVKKSNWTDYKYVTSAWTYLKKGDQLFYFESKGHNTTVTFTFKGNIGSVKVTVPLGDTNQKGQGVAKTAPKAGKYKIKAKKKVQETVVYVDRRAYINDTPRGKWKFNYVDSKSSKVLEVVPNLVRK